MRSKKLIYLLFFVPTLLIGAYIFQDKKNSAGNDENVRYELVQNWLRLPAGLQLGNPTGLGIDSNQNIFILYRGIREWPILGRMPKSFIKENTVWEIENKTGKILNSWGNNLFIMPHGLTVDKDNNVWITDVGLSLSTGGKAESFTKCPSTGSGLQLDGFRFLLLNFDFAFRISYFPLPTSNLFRSQSLHRIHPRCLYRLKANCNYCNNQH